MNDYRASRGLSKLAWSDVVAERACQHSRDMATGATDFGHDGFKDRAAGIGRKIPWTGVAENVFMMTGRTNEATVAVRGWLDSPHHRENIEGDFDLAGVGVARAPNGALYFTQIFVKAR